MDYLSNSRRKGRNVNSFLAFLLFVCMSVMPVMAQQDKNVTLNVKNETVENVLKSLGQQTGLKFFYDQNVVNVSPRVTLQASGASLQSVLNQISSQTQLSFNRNNNTITVGTLKAGGTDNQKKMKVTGVVVDANGEPIIGANVWVKGTTSGVITNVDGNFVIDAPLHSVLTVSYIGFLAQDIEVKDSKALRVVIQEDTQKLEEVVVIGYGTMKKKDLMGANTGVSGDNLAASSNISVGGALQGKMSGISIMNSGGFPGAETSINIRGIGTFGSGDSAPLIVIDGVPVDQGFETLNPNDIESVNVLKDASSAAIYGFRAANGVILVTTKKGASGKATVSMNATFGIQSPMHMMDLLDASEFVAAIQEMRDNYNAIYKPSTPAVTNYDGLDPESFGKGTNWGDYIYQSAPTYNINASVSGIKEVVAYAAERYIMIVPEFEMPGHESAAIAAYPWLGTTGRQIDVPCRFGVQYEVMDVTSSRVQGFIEDVLDEIITIFPSPVIHIGGDEVKFDQWNASTSIQKYMTRQGIETPADLQIVFTNRISHLLQQKERRMMGWNDITGNKIHEYNTETDATAKEKLADGTIVQFWKGDLNLIEKTASQGYDIVNSYHYKTYLDYDYQKIPLEKAYEFDPVPEGLPEDLKKKILGLGCQMWGEEIMDNDKMYYQIFPRIAAYAECGWTLPGRKDYFSFLKPLEKLKIVWRTQGLMK